MNKDIKEQILNEIFHLSGNNNRLAKLLTYSIGRLCISSFKAGKDWKAELKSIDLSDVAKWLKNAIYNEEEWLSELDSNNRPKKLMGFSSFEELAKIASNEIAKSNEELYMELEDGYHLVKLITPEAIEREAVKMQSDMNIAIHENAFDGNKTEVFSLRDRNKDSHATLQIHDDELVKLQGRQDASLLPKYSNALKPYFRKLRTSVGIPIANLGYIVSNTGETFDLGSLPDGLKVSGNLNLDNANISSLPEGLNVDGNLILGENDITSIPRNCVVGRDLGIGHSGITHLNEGLEVGDDLDMSHTEITSLPEDIKVGANIDMHRSKIEKLPKGLKIVCDIDISMSNITELPENLKVGGDRIMYETRISKLPEGLEVGGDLDIAQNDITELPRDLYVSGSLNSIGTKIITIPSEASIEGEIILQPIEYKIAIQSP